MSKLLKVKQWLTIPDTAEYLSILLKEKVKPSDIYQLAMAGNLNLSILITESAMGKKGVRLELDQEENFLSEVGLAVGKVGKLTQVVKVFPESRKVDNVGWTCSEKTSGESMSDMLTGVWSALVSLGNITEKYIDNYIFFEDIIFEDINEFFGFSFLADIVVLKGLYDLVIYDDKNNVVINSYANILNTDSDVSECLSPIFVSDGDRTYCLSEMKNKEGHSPADFAECYSATKIPEKSFLVIKTEEISSFINNLLGGNESKKETTTKERKSLHLIIAALLELAEYDIEQPYAAAKEIMYKIKESSHISENTVASHLKAAKETASNL